MATLVRMSGPVTTDELRDLMQRAAILPAKDYETEEDDIEYDEVARQSTLVHALCSAYRVFSKGEKWVNTGTDATKLFSTAYLAVLQRLEPVYYADPVRAIDGVDWPAWVTDGDVELPEWLIKQVAQVQAVEDVKRLREIRKLAEEDRAAQRQAKPRDPALHPQPAR